MKKQLNSIGVSLYNKLQYAKHINVMKTRDGGLSIYLPKIRDRKMDDLSHWGQPEDDMARKVGVGEEDVLLARCHCGNVSFQIKRPDESSHIPQRSYPDLIHPCCSNPPARVAKQEDEKWWLRPPRRGISLPRSQAEDQSTPARYLAGNCACRSCRMTSGFEIQSWAFVPRSNIFFHIPRPATDQTDLATAKAAVSLDFNTLPTGILQSYSSSPGVARDFCAKCGATVFWREQQNAEVVDISVGLFDALEGARAENWLEWWTERVSFSEEAGTGRHGEVAARAEGLIESLKRGMKDFALRSG
ncbi:hypothetical protein N0V93_006358 [Gnomoniopsis smithogilvyi]|uniref:CENP-V/GFA domain-containing protein n=1 Tax=Gnomoniopsis smithogilvyi TaxID=1191159 RepID=A0A9W9CVM3_9PEZI|nr:hypothetical protein N0V93_006358 [Gnomoniopsis smithogilvyi]